jgi:hypothetical protein
MAGTDAPATRLDALREILVTAHELATTLARDPLVERILRAFAKLPERDREPILEIIERDASWCALRSRPSGQTGIRLRPNPHASLYVRVFDQVDAPTEPLRRDVEVIGFGIERFVQMIPLFFQDGVRQQWTASARVLMRDIDPQLVDYVRRLASDVLALIAEETLEAT